MKKLYFIAGSQDLYGEAVLRQVAKDAKDIADFLNGQLAPAVGVEYAATVRDSDEAEDVLVKASADKDCVGVICWMHTFSPAKMWIRGLQALKKPLLHLHTQHNEKLPYDTIDMDFMNLNQSAHGDREFGFICTRLGVKREVVVGYYKHPETVEAIRKFADVATALNFSHGMKVAMFGNNMRDVAVTDGDRVESEIRYGWNVNYYAVGDLVSLVNAVTEEETDKKMAQYAAKYTMATDNIASVREQARYEIAREKFIDKERVGAFTVPFQDLYGLR